MPKQVRGADGRVIHDQLSDADALDLARRVHAAEGEVVTLVPFVFDGEEYVLDESGATTVGAAPEDVVEEVVPEPKPEPVPTPKVPKEPRAPRAPKEPKPKATPKARAPKTKTPPKK